MPQPRPISLCSAFIFFICVSAFCANSMGQCQQCFLICNKKNTRQPVQPCTSFISTPCIFSMVGLDPLICFAPRGRKGRGSRAEGGGGWEVLGSRGCQRIRLCTMLSVPREADFRLHVC